MHWKNGMAQGFALFAHGAAASQAIQTVNGMVFDDGVVSSTHLLHTTLLFDMHLHNVAVIVHDMLQQMHFSGAEGSLERPPCTKVFLCLPEHFFGTCPIVCHWRILHCQENVRREPEVQMLRCEMARKNMYIRDDAATAAKRGRVGGEYNPYATAPAASPVPAYYAPAPVVRPLPCAPA